MINRKGHFGYLFFYAIVAYYFLMSMIGVYIPKGGIGPVMMVAMLLLIVYYGIIKNPFWTLFNYIYLFTFFVFILILLTSHDFMYSLRMWIKMCLGLISLPVGFNLFSNEKSIKKYWHVIISILIFYVIYSVLANVFHFGGGYGGDSSEYETGNLFAEALFSNVYFITMVPFFLRYNTNKLLVLLTVSIVSVLVILNMKRTPIAVGLVSLVVVVAVRFYLNIRFGRIASESSKKYLLVFLLLFGGTFLYFQDTIEKQIDIRSDRFEGGRLEREGRFVEFLYIYEENVENGSIEKILFGKETFNIIGTYAGGRFGKRQIHEDYGMLLHSTGIVGISSYIGLQLFLLYLPYRRRYVYLFTLDKDNRLLLALYSALIVSHFVSMSSGVIRMSFSEMIYYMFLGMILRILYEQYYNNDMILRQSLEVEEIESQ